VYNPFPRVGQHIAVIFFSVIKFVKSNHRPTLKNESLGELICTALTTYCPDFRGLQDFINIKNWQITVHQLI